MDAYFHAEEFDIGNPDEVLAAAEDTAWAILAEPQTVPEALRAIRRFLVGWDRPKLLQIETITNGPWAREATRRPACVASLNGHHEESTKTLTPSMRIVTLDDKSTGFGELVHHDYF